MSLMIATFVAHVKFRQGICTYESLSSVVGDGVIRMFHQPPWPAEPTTIRCAPRVPKTLALRLARVDQSHIRVRPDRSPAVVPYDGASSAPSQVLFTAENKRGNGWNTSTATRISLHRGRRSNPGTAHWHSRSVRTGLRFPLQR